MFVTQNYKRQNVINSRGDFHAWKHLTHDAADVGFFEHDSSTLEHFKLSLLTTTPHDECKVGFRDKLVVET